MTGTVLHSLGYRSRIIGVIDAAASVCPVIPAALTDAAQMFQQALLEFKPGVIAAQGYDQVLSLPKS